MKLLGAIFMLVNAAVISAVAIYVSIYGMISLFAAHALVVAIMIGSIEVGKLSAATWLKFNWRNRTIGVVHKVYLLAAVIIVSVLTAIGCFGFLSAGHLEQNAPLAGLSIQTQQYQVQLDQATGSNKRIETRLAQIDANINAFLTNGAASKGLRASESLKRERDQLQAQMDDNNKLINDLNTKLAPIKQQSTEVEAKLGPVKYLASAMGYDDPEVAVNMVILLIMLAFDPLAVVLIISAMATFKQIEEEKSAPTVAKITAPIINDGAIAVPVSFEAKFEVADPKPVSGNIHSQTEMVPEIAATSKPKPFIDALNDYVGPPTPALTSRDFANMMAAKALTPPGRFAFASNTPVVISANGHAIHKEAPEPDIRTRLLDMLEQYPEIVNEVIATAREIEKTKSEDGSTISSITGATVD